MRLMDADVLVDPDQTANALASSEGESGFGAMDKIVHDMSKPPSISAATLHEASFGAHDAVIDTPRGLTLARRAEVQPVPNGPVAAQQDSSASEGLDPRSTRPAALELPAVTPLDDQPFRSGGTNFDYDLGAGLYSPPSETESSLRLRGSRIGMLTGDEAYKRQQAAIADARETRVKAVELRENAEAKLAEVSTVQQGAPATGPITRKLMIDDAKLILQRAVEGEQRAIAAERVALTTLPTQAGWRNKLEVAERTLGKAGVSILDTLRAISARAPHPNEELDPAFKEAMDGARKQARRDIDTLHEAVNRTARPDPAQAEQLDSKLTESAVDMGTLMPTGAATKILSIGARPVARVIDRALPSKPPRVDIYNPPRRAPRAFEEDYPAGVLAPNATGPLTRDIEGRPLAARYIAGRRTVGGADEALTPAQVHDAATEVIGSKPRIVPASKLPPNTVGLYTAEMRGNELVRKIRVLRGLPRGITDQLVGHEFGHAIEDVAGQIHTKGLADELERVYNTLNNPRRLRAEAAPGGRPFLPQDLGYEGQRAIWHEYVAEAIRAYMADPNYLKSVAPRTAAAIRAAVNPNPILRKFIQFNSIAAAAAVPLTGAVTEDDGEAWEPDRL